MTRLENSKTEKRNSGSHMAQLSLSPQQLFVFSESSLWALAPSDASPQVSPLRSATSEKMDRKKEMMKERGKIWSDVGVGGERRDKHRRGGQVKSKSGIGRWCEWRLERGVGGHSWASCGLEGEFSPNAWQIKEDIGYFSFPKSHWHITAQWRIKKFLEGERTG